MKKKDPDMQPLRLLILEDNPADVELALRELRRSGLAFSHQLADNQRAFEQGLQEFAPHVILSDFTLPGFDGLTALKIARKQAPDVPFIFVSGSIGEAMAVETLALGAADYIFKDNLKRLASAVKRIAADAETRRLKQEAEERLRKSEEYYRTLVDTSPDAIIIVNAGGRVTFASSRARKLFELPDDAPLEGGSISGYVEAEEWNRVQQRLAELLSGRSSPEVREYRLCRHDGRFFWGEIFSAPLRDASGRITDLLLICRDVSERKRNEEALLRSEAKFRKIFEEHAAVKLLMDAETGRIVDANTAAAEFYGWSQDVLKTMSIGQINILPPADIAKAIETVKEQKRVHFEFRHRRADGSVRDVEVFSSRIDMEGKTFLHSIVHDITERRRAEEQVRYQAHLLQEVSDAIIATDRDDAIRVWNKAAEKVYGWKAEEAIGRKFHDLIRPEYTYQRREEVIESLDKEGVWSGELVHHLRQGNKIPVQSTITILREGASGRSGLVSINHDITERKLAEERIKASLKEKEVLLQEIHHRVKNNLQIISGLLTLQADQAGGKTLADIFQESQDRIRSIALIHEKLYRSQNLAEIDFGLYLRDLVGNLLISHGVAAGRIAAHFDVEPVFFTIDKAIPLGLIVNELVVNVIKHAFPGGRGGDLNISMHVTRVARSAATKTESGSLVFEATCELVVADNGVGLPDTFAFEGQKSLGTYLVNMLARQLQAELRVEPGPGASFRLSFQTSLPSRRGADPWPKQPS